MFSQFPRKILLFKCNSIIVHSSYPFSRPNLSKITFVETDKQKTFDLSLRFLWFPYVDMYTGELKSSYDKVITAIDDIYH